MGTGGIVLMGPAQPPKHVIDELSLELRMHVVRLQDAQRRFDSDIYLRSLLSQKFSILLLIYILIWPHMTSWLLVTLPHFSAAILESKRVQIGEMWRLFSVHFFGSNSMPDSSSFFPNEISTWMVSNLRKLLQQNRQWLTPCCLVADCG